MNKILVVSAIFLVSFMVAVAGNHYAVMSIFAQENSIVTVDKTIVSSSDDTQDKYRNAGLAVTQIIPAFPAEEK